MNEKNMETQDNAMQHHVFDAGKVIGKAKVWALIAGIICAYLGARGLGWCYNLLGFEHGGILFVFMIITYFAMGAFFVISRNFTYRTNIKAESYRFKNLELFVIEEAKIIKPEKVIFVRLEYLEWLAGIIILLGLFATLGIKCGWIEGDKVEEHEIPVEEYRMWDRHP